MTALDPPNGRTAAAARFFKEPGGDRTGLAQIHGGFVKGCDFSFGTGPGRPEDRPLFQVSAGQDVYGAGHVAHVSGKAPPRIDGVRFGVEFADGCLLDDEDHAALAEGLSCWTTRVGGWKDACLRMTACPGSAEEIVSKRLLTAWRWFERLPHTEEQKVLDRKAIMPPVDAAFAAARKNGRDVSRERTQGKLQELRNESFRQVVRRLVNRAAGAGLGDLAGDLRKDIIAGRKLRGDAAHGRPGRPRRQNAIQPVRSASATRAFTAGDLPLTPARRERLKHHPLVADYRRLLAADRAPSHRTSAQHPPRAGGVRPVYALCTAGCRPVRRVFQHLLAMPPLSCRPAQQGTARPCCAQRRAHPEARWATRSSIT